MRPTTTRRRSRRVLIVVTLLALTFVTLDATGGMDPVRNVAADVLEPVGRAVAWLTTPVRNAWQGITGYDELEKENEELRGELDGIRAEAARETNYAEQLERLTEQLNIRFVGELPTQVARVASGPRSNFEDNRVVIDKGRDAGLEVGMPVVTKAGLVGRLDRVAGSTSVVQLITDPAFVAGVRVATTQDLGVGHGSGAGNPFVVDQGIEIGDQVEEGDPVLTSGLDRSVMPPDIPIGLVTEVQPDEASRSLILRVDPGEHLSQLDVVQVVKWTPPP